MQRYTNRITVRLTDDELQRMKSRMAEHDITTMSNYMRKMILDGYFVVVNDTGIDEVNHLLKTCSNNLNQYAKKANGMNVVYKEDIEDLQKRLDEIFNCTDVIMNRLRALK